MRRLALSAVLAGSCGGLPPDPGSASHDPPSSPASVPLVLDDVRVLTMLGDSVSSGRTVVIVDGRVEAIGDREVARPAGAVVVAGRGRYLMPALIDMHVHTREADLPAYLRAGVTTVRNMWGWPGLPAIIGRVESGAVRGPRIVSASQGLDAQPEQPATIIVTTPAEGAAAVRAQHADGWHWIKVYNLLSRDTYLAILDEARMLGLRAVGHVPLAIGVEDALAAGQHSIEHLTGYDRRVSPNGRWGTWAWINPDASRYDGLAALTRDAGAWNCPTLAIYVALARQHSPAEQVAIIRERRAFVGALHRAGAPLLAGSDAGIDVVAPGTSLHDELAELVASGLSPYQALRAATIDAGRFLAIEGLGTLVAGAPADLLLVPENPLQDLGRLRRFEAMVHRGAWIPAGSLPAAASSR